MRTQLQILLHNFWGKVQCFFNHHDMGKWKHMVGKYYSRRCIRCGAKEIGRLNKSKKQFPYNQLNNGIDPFTK